jgi:hypothetical protein
MLVKKKGKREKKEGEEGCIVFGICFLLFFWNFYVGSEKNG